MTDAIGIDAGSYKTVLACVKQRGIEIVLSETSAKWTPTIAAYTEQERVVGDAAVNQMKKNFKNTSQFFARFLGLNQDCVDQLAEEKQFITYKVVDLENKKIGFEMLCRGERQVFTPEQVFGFYLRKVKTYFEKAGMPSKEIVIAVPTYATNAERQAYLDACDIAGINCIRLINESTATALTYGFFRKADLDAEKPRTVCFVDFGHASLIITYASFIKGKMKILGTHSNRNLGARKIDLLLFELLGGEFAKKYGCDPRKNVRCRLRLLDAIEKLRKLLTGNKEADINCEALMEDEDLHRHIKRDEFEELIGPFIAEFRKVLEESLVKAGVAKEKIDFIELVGEATRIPICIQNIKDCFGKEPSRTLNSTDCIARGCALQAAMLSPNFQVAQFQVEEYNEVPICISYKFNDSEKIVTKELFKVGTSFPSTKSITFDNKVGNLMLAIHYADGANIAQGQPSQIARYEIQEGKKEEKTEKTSFTMRVSNNIHNVACLDQVEFCQMWTEEEKIPIKMMPNPPPKAEEKKADATPPKEGEQPAEENGTAPTVPEPPAPVEQQYEIKKRDKKKFSDLKFTSSSFALGPTQRVEFANMEQRLVDGDSDILTMKALRNDLEAYSYEMRSNLESYGTLEKYLDDETKKAFIAEINQVVDWIYGDGEVAPKEEYRSKLEKFKKIGDPVKQRHFYYSELEVYYAQFDQITQHIQKRTGEIAHLTDEQKTMIQGKHQAAQDFMDKVKTDRAAKQLHQDPAYTLDQIISTLTLVKKETEAIFNLPPPKPKEEAPKKEEDAPMKEDEQMPDLAEQNAAPETNEEMKNEESKATDPPQ